jgi:hypothetical protein
MMAIIILLLTIFLSYLSHSSLTTASPITTCPSENSPIARGNKNVWVWNIDPDVTNPYCSTAYRVNINLKSSPKDIWATANPQKCSNLFNFITGRPGSPDVDLFLRCDTHLAIADPGTQDGKLIWTYDVEKFDDAIDWNKEGDQEIPGSMRVSDRVYGYIVDVPLRLGVKVDTKKKQVKYQFLYR